MYYAPALSRKGFLKVYTLPMSYVTFYDVFKSTDFQCLKQVLPRETIAFKEQGEQSEGGSFGLRSFASQGPVPYCTV